MGFKEKTANQRDLHKCVPIKASPHANPVLTFTNWFREDCGSIINPILRPHISLRNTNNAEKRKNNCKATASEFLKEEKFIEN